MMQRTPSSGPTLSPPWSVVPFVLPQTLKPGQHNGRGVLVQVTGAANTDLTITHGLGRVPVFVIPLDNGTAFTPKVKRGATAWTVAKVTVQFDVAPSACWVWIV